MEVVYRDRYKCYDDGRIYDLKRDCWTTQTLYGKYYTVFIYGIGSMNAHRVIWEAFNGPIPSGYNIHHKNKNPLDNNISNLQCIEEHQHLSEHRKGHAPNFEWTKERTAKRLQTRKQKRAENPQYGISHKFGQLNGMYGKKHTEQWRKEHSEAMTGSKNPNFGKKWTKEAIQRRVAKFKQNKLKKLQQINTTNQSY